MVRYSRVDILTLALGSGMDYDAAEDLMFDLSPECETVPASKVKRAIAKALDN